MELSAYEELEQRIFMLLKAGDTEEVLHRIWHGVDQHDRNSALVLAQLYQHGIGVKKNVRKALELYHELGEAGSGRAYVFLGNWYMEGDEGLEADAEKAAKYFRKGAELGNRDAMALLGECYIFGDGVVIDYGFAFYWTKKGARLGSKIGIGNLGICYDDGIGVKRDAMQAAIWYKKAVKLETENGFWMYRIACCLADPFHVYGILPTGEALQEAFEWCKKAVEYGNLDAHLLLGWFYEKGIVVERDLNTAHAYIKVAAQNGNHMARKVIRRYRKQRFSSNYILRTE